ncbi:unnamed protein product, partial [Heterotrigona itama]
MIPVSELFRDRHEIGGDRRNSLILLPERRGRGISCGKTERRGQTAGFSDTERICFSAGVESGRTETEIEGLPSAKVAEIKRISKTKSKWKGARKRGRKGRKRTLAHRPTAALQLACNVPPLLCHSCGKHP